MKVERPVMAGHATFQPMTQLAKVSVTFGADIKPGQVKT
jgi:hypothetical protein